MLTLLLMWVMILQMLQRLTDLWGETGCHFTVHLNTYCLYAYCIQVMLHVEISSLAVSVSPPHTHTQSCHRMSPVADRTVGKRGILSQLFMESLNRFIISSLFEY